MLDKKRKEAKREDRKKAPPLNDADPFALV
jgi:hypothetical protein